MNKYERLKKMMPIILIFAIAIFLVPNIAAAPTVEINPAQPKPNETITFTATMDTDNIDQVNIHVEECSNSLCFTDDFNVTMTETSENTYTATITLRHEDAVYFRYELFYLTEDGWEIYPESKNMIKVDLDTSGQSNTDNGNGDDTASDTPGFELGVLFISVIFISLILYRRKR